MEQIRDIDIRKSSLQSLDSLRMKVQMKMKTLADNITLMRCLLGLGYFIQGFWCFPWMIVIFFLKDTLQVDPSTLQILQNTANLPMVGKSLYGIVSDVVYINGEHCIPYIAFGAFLQAISWILVAILSMSGLSIFRMTLFLLLGNLGASISEVANDAIVAEIGKRKTCSKSAESDYTIFGKRKTNSLYIMITLYFYFDYTNLYTLITLYLYCDYTTLYVLITLS